MSNSTFNFRAALREVTEGKQKEIELCVERILRKVIQNICESEDLISPEMLKEILFLQSADSCGEDIEVGIRRNVDEEEEDLFIQVECETCDSSADAAVILEEIRSQLTKEEFSIEDYSGEDAVDGGKSFIIKNY